jgi:transposase
MIKSIPRALEFQGFKTVDLKEWLSKGFIEIYLEPTEEAICFRCKNKLTQLNTGYSCKVKHLNLFTYKTILKFKKRVGWCSCCRKERSEYINFVSEESPHITKDLAWFIAKHCEISSVSKTARITDVDKMLAYRVDHRILVRLLAGYKIPKVTRISVDEVYARKKKKEGETRDDLFLTIITDLKTHKVIYVSHSRRKEALDYFFELLGPDACINIKVVACDQHEAYKNSVEQYCPNAKVVWDRFHLMQNFNLAVNEARKTLFNKKLPDEVRRRLHGRNRFIFLTRQIHRTENEQQFVNELMEMNQEFFLLELIKEKFASFFDAKNIDGKGGAKEIWEDLGLLIFKLYDMTLIKWYKNLEKDFKQVLLYFKFRVTTAVSEGVNNVIKSLKRRAFGYKNMNYFALKILQLCGYLNSQYISNPYEVGIKK